MGKKKPKTSAAEGNGTGSGNGSGAVSLPPIKRCLVALRIRGISPLIQHQWSEKALREIREKHAGKKTKNRDVRNPEEEGRNAAYRTDDGKYGVPALAIKSSMIGAAHKDIGIEKTLVKKALFIICEDSKKVLSMDCDEPVITEDPVRVGSGSTDLRYRPYYHRWTVDVQFEIDKELLQVKDLVNLIDRAGFGVGIGEWRPEKGGEYGRFEVDRSVPVEEKDV
jgi:hypothetical protein